MCPSSTRTSATEVAIRDAQAGDLPACRELFREYERAIGVSLCFQDFEREVAGLPGDYAAPRGGLWVLEVNGALAGCVALRPLSRDEGEMKRLYVRPAFRGLSLGRALARHVIAVARGKGYRVLRLDTLATMKSAQVLYAHLGFVDTAPYNDNPIEDTRFLALAL
jgi:putative acetyltransferase